MHSPTHPPTPRSVRWLRVLGFDLYREDHCVPHEWLRPPPPLHFSVPILATILATPHLLHPHPPTHPPHTHHTHTQDPATGRTVKAELKSQYVELQKASDRDAGVRGRRGACESGVEA